MLTWQRTLGVLALAAATIASLPVALALAEERKDTLTVGMMWEPLPMPTARRSRFFNESEILDTLIKFDHDMVLVPGLATSWEQVSPTVWHFDLRQGVTFHDGTAFDADAAKNSLERVVALLPYAADLLNIAHIETKGPHKLEIETKAPFAALPNQLTDAFTGIYAPSSFNSTGEFVKAVGTGPWRLVEYVKQDHTLVERFDGYWGTAPSLARIEYRYIPDHNSRVLALETGEIDFADNLPPADVARLAADPAFKTYAQPVAGLYYGEFNTRSDAPLTDPRLRRAINLLVNRQVLVEGALDGVGEPAWELFAPRYAWVPTGVEPYALNPNAATKLLQEAGYIKVDGHWQKDGEPLTLRILSYPSRTEMPMLTEALAALLKDAGIDSKVQLYTWEGMLDVARRGEFDITLVFWTPELVGHPDQHLRSQFHSKANANYQGWSNIRFDELIDSGRTLEPGRKRDDTYREALNILQDDAPILPLVHKVFVAASKADVVGYRVHPSGFFYDFKKVSKSN